MLTGIAPCSPPIEFAPSSSPLPYAVFAPTLFEFDPSSRVRPLIEWYPDELICDEGTNRMCQMSRQRRPFCLAYYSDWKRCKTTWVYLTNTKCVDRNNQTWEDANHAFIATALLKLLDLYPFSFIYEIKTEEFTHQLTNQLIWISLNQGANSTWWGRTRKVWGRTRYKVGANSKGRTR